MKKTIFALVAAIGLGLGATTWQRVSDGEGRRIVVLLSSEEWKKVKITMDRHGICDIKDQNTVLVITNGVPEIERFVDDLLDGDRDFRRQRRINSPSEPQPYQRQSR